MSVPVPKGRFVSGVMLPSSTDLNRAACKRLTPTENNVCLFVNLKFIQFLLFGLIMRSLGLRP